MTILQGWLAHLPQGWPAIFLTCLFAALTVAFLLGLFQERAARGAAANGFGDFVPMIAGMLGFALLFVLTLVATWVAFGTMANMIWGKRVEYEGLAVALVDIPLSMLLGLFTAYFLRRRASLMHRHLAFVISSVGFAAALGYAMTAALLGAEPEQDFVYIPAADYVASVHITAPALAFVGRPVSIKVERKAGPWQRVPLYDLKGGIAYFSELPLPSDPRVAGEPILETDPPGCMRVESLDPITGEGKAVFSESQHYGENCKVWVTMDDPLRATLARSLVVSVMVMPAQ